MWRFLKSIDRRFYVFALAWALLQLVLIIIFYNEPFGNDQYGYEIHAIQSFNLGTFYPSQANLYDEYIQGPGLVNAMIPFYALFGSVRSFMFLSLVMNVAILFEIVFVGFRLFSHRVGYIAAMAYALLLSNIFAATQINTEVLYLFLALTGFCLTLGDKLWQQALAGLLYAVAWTVRPLVLAFVVASVVLYIYKRKKWLVKSVSCIAALAIPLALLAVVNNHRLGAPVISSTTGGYNLLMTAVPDATPFPNHHIYMYIGGYGNKEFWGHYTFYQRDSIWKNRAFAYIRKNPARYFVLCLERVPLMWNKDTWSIPNLLGHHFDDPTYASLSGNDTVMLKYQLVRMAYSVAYYIVCLFAIIGMIRFRRQILGKKGIPLIVLLLGIGGTCLLPIEQRLHYPYMWVVCLWAAMEMEHFYLKRKTKQ